MPVCSTTPGVAPLLLKFADLFTAGSLPGPVLDLACGDCRNGIFLAEKNVSVICCDRSFQGLDLARSYAEERQLPLTIWQTDLEMDGINPLPEDSYGGILVFRYLHRPLIPFIREALRVRGVLMYETFTVEQPKYGKPHNPDFLLKPGELARWFQDWEIIHYFEGIQENPTRAIARIVCRKLL